MSGEVEAQQQEASGEKAGAPGVQVEERDLLTDLNRYDEYPSGDRYPRKLSWFLRSNPHDFGYELGLGVVSREGVPISVGTSITCRDAKRGDVVPALIRLDRKHLQDFMDQIWNYGIRPSEFRQKDVPTETLEAMQNHIDDLKAERDFLRGITTEAVRASLRQEEEEPKRVEMRDVRPKLREYGELAGGVG